MIGPGARLRLLGRLMVGTDATVAAALEGLDGADWSRLLQEAGEDLVTPQIAATLLAPEVAAWVPDAVLDHVADMAAANRARTDRIEGQLREILDGLADRGVAALLLKGARDMVVSRDCVPPLRRPGRVLCDLDILVRPAQELEAAVVLSSLGYRLIDRDRDEGHAMGYFARPGEPAAIDLHHALLEAHHLLPVDEVWSRACPAPGDAAGAPLVLSAPDELLHRVLHETVQHWSYRNASISVRALADILFWFPAMTEQDWEIAAERAARQRCAAPLGFALALVGWLFGPDHLPLPARRLTRGLKTRLMVGRAAARLERRLPAGMDRLLSRLIGLTAGYRYGAGSSVAFWRGRLRQALLGGAAPAGRE